MELIKYILDNNRYHVARTQVITKDETKHILEQYLELLKKTRHGIELNGMDYDTLVSKYAGHNKISEIGMYFHFMSETNINVDPRC